MLRTLTISILLVIFCWLWADIAGGTTLAVSMFSLFRVGTGGACGSIIIRFFLLYGLFEAGGSLAFSASSVLVFLFVAVW